MRDKSTVLIVIALGCGIVASVIVSQRMEQEKRSAPEPEIAPLLVAATDIDIGEELTADNVRLEHWPRRQIPAQAITGLEQLQDGLPAARISAGEAILAGKLSPVAPPWTPALGPLSSAAPVEPAGVRESAAPELQFASQELQFASQEPPAVAIDEQPAFEPASGPANAPAGYRIDSVRVVLTPSTSQLLPGDRIDLVADMSRACTAPRMLTRTTLWNVQVLEADPQWQRELDGDGIVTGWTGTVSLLVQRDQVEPLLLARSRGRLQVTADRSISAEERVAGYRLPPSLHVTR